MAKSKRWPKIGTVRRNDDGRSYIKLEDNVTILVDGKEVNMNDRRVVQLDDPRAKLDYFFENGHIDEKNYEKRKETLAENDWLRYELTVPPKN